MKTENKELKAKAFAYYCKGLNSKEIGKLLDVSYRTVQNWMYADGWKAKRQPTPLKKRVLHLHKQGFSYNSIADILNVSRSSVYNWLKIARNE